MAGRHAFDSRVAKAANSPIGRTAAMAMAVGTVFGLAMPTAQASEKEVDNKALLGALGGQAKVSETQATEAVSAPADAQWDLETVAVQSASDDAVALSATVELPQVRQETPATHQAQTRTQTRSQERATATAQARVAQAAAAAQADAAAQAQASQTQAAQAQAETPAPASQAGSATGNAIVAKALSYIGTPYRWGGSTPSGWDCSGFVSYVYAQFGFSLPHASAAYPGLGHRVSYSEVQPGDILYWPGHVAISLGGGRNVGALNPKRGTNYSMDKYYNGTPIVIRLYN